MESVENIGMESIASEAVSLEHIRTESATGSCDGHSYTYPIHVYRVQCAELAADAVTGERVAAPAIVYQASSPYGAWWTAKRFYPCYDAEGETIAEGPSLHNIRAPLARYLGEHAEPYAIGVEVCEYNEDLHEWDEGETYQRTIRGHGWLDPHEIAASWLERERARRQHVELELNDVFSV